MSGEAKDSEEKLHLTLKCGNLLLTILCKVDSVVCNQKNMAINTLHSSILYNLSQVSGAVSFSPRIVTMSLMLSVCYKQIKKKKKSHFRPCPRNYNSNLFNYTAVLPFH